MSKLVPIDVMPTDRVETEEEKVETGQWYWYTYEGREYNHDIEEYETKTYRSLVCVTNVGSNYVGIRSPHGHKWRVHFNEFDQVCERELNHRAILDRKVEQHQNKVRDLLDEVKELTNRLGIVPHGELATESQTTSALAVASGTADIKAHKEALIKAKKDLLPDLFKQIEKEHESMAIWMKADLIPAKAQLTNMQTATEAIEDRIFTVELYAGLTESLVQIKDGKPAANDTKVSLFQRRHYMDEECLLNYRAGGMNFENIGDFDEWLLEPANLNRILPKDRSIVAFRIRRNAKNYGYAATLADFIAIRDQQARDEATYLYIRNGEQVWRLITDIDFGEELFPDSEHAMLLNSKDVLYINEKVSSPEKVIITEREVEEELALDAENQRKYEHACEVWRAWRDARDKAADQLGIDPETPDGRFIVSKANRYVTDGEPRNTSSVWGDDEKEEDGRMELVRKLAAAYIEADKGFTVTNGDLVVDGKRLWRGPCTSDYSDSFSERRNGDWVKVTSETTTYYDDVMKKIHNQAKEHNRVAVVLQGLLDRSPCLHPHPPYRLWTMEGFQQGIELVYDQTRAITSGDPLNFSEYFKQLGKSIKVGSVVIGQEIAWMEMEAEKEAQRRDRLGKNSFDRDYYRPHGNPGPGYMAKVVKIRGGKAYFEWTKESKKSKWVDIPDDPGYMRREWPQVKQSFSIEIDKLFNVSAYTPGDYKMFYADPRTRRNYLQWAPLLLSAENYHANPGKYFPDKTSNDDDDEA